PPHQQKQVRLQLGAVLRGVISQRLVPRADGKGSVAAVEVMVANSRVREMIEDKDRTKEISQAIAQSHTTYGMQTFDQSLMFLFRQGLITYEEALRQSSNPDDFALRVSGISATSDSSWDGFEKAPEDATPPTGAQKTPLSQPRVPPSAAPRPPGMATPIGSIPVTQIAVPASQARNTPVPAPASQTAGPAPAAADDDFQIERF